MAGGNGLFAGVVTIDLRKAFDVVHHKLLLEKQQINGLNKQLPQMV